VKAMPTFQSYFAGDLVDEVCVYGGGGAVVAMMLAVAVLL